MAEGAGEPISVKAAGTSFTGRWVQPGPKRTDRSKGESKGRGRRGSPGKELRQEFWKQVQRGEVGEAGSLCVASLPHH